jgi:hypothetical protein
MALLSAAKDEFDIFRTTSPTTPLDYKKLFPPPSKNSEMSV